MKAEQKNSLQATPLAQAKIHPVVSLAGMVKMFIEKMNKEGERRQSTQKQQQQGNEYSL